MTEQHPPLSFDEFVETIAPLGGSALTIADEVQEVIREASTALRELETVDRQSLTELVAAHPDWAPVLGLAVELSQEQLRNLLNFHAGTSSHTKLAKEDPAKLIEILDTEELRLVDRVSEHRVATFEFADILIARAGGRSRAGRAIKMGRQLEDLVEEVVTKLGVSYALRTRFIGRDKLDAPCDVAIPEGGSSAQIVCAVKGFGSTGSKLSDAVREVEQMASVRRPNQYVFVVVDGIGWLNRKNDLRKLYEIWAARSIDGLYTLARFEEFAIDLADAVTRLGLHDDKG